MSDASQKRSALDRVRGPMTLIMLGIAGFALYYSLFFQRKTAYFSSRDARLIARVTEQLRRSIDGAARVVDSAATVPAADLENLYRYRANLAAEQRPAGAIFDEIHIATATAPREPRRSLELLPNGALQVVFEGKPAAPIAATVDPSAPPAVRASAPPVTATQPAQPPAPQPYVVATINFKRLMDTIVRQTVGDGEVFDTTLILDDEGNVIYQSPPPEGDDSGGGLRIVRLKQLRARHLVDKEETLDASTLLGTSRQMAVHIGDGDYELFSAPMVSNVEASHHHAAGESNFETWVVAGLVSTADFRSRSLAISSTLLSCLGAAVLLILFAWPFLKLALIHAQHRVTVADAILLGVSGILATALVALIALDLIAYRRIERMSDEQLADLARQLELHFRSEVALNLQNLDQVQAWIEAQPRPFEARNTDLLQRLPLQRPWFQSIALIGSDGMQRAKWTVDRPATALVQTRFRTYFSAPFGSGRAYRAVGGRKVTIESISSSTTGQPEVAFSRRTADTPRPGDAKLRAQWPVIALTSSSALSLVHPILPHDFGFAIIDDRGVVQFHSDTQRNTVENFFVETDANAALRSAVAARQGEYANVRYWGDDYRAYVHPMSELPWTVITFRDKRGMRAVNTETLTIAMIFLLSIFGPLLLLFVCLVLLLRPRYRAPWLWPDALRVDAYVELAATYAVLGAIALALLLRLHDVVLLLFPFSFLPLVLLVTYLYLRRSGGQARRIAVAALAAVCAVAVTALVWRGDGALPAVVTAVLLLLLIARPALRPDDLDRRERRRARATALPLCYIGCAFLLLLLVSVVPTAAFFKAAQEMELDSYVKRQQMSLARELADRWWRVSGEFSDLRGAGKLRARTARWNEMLDRYADAAPGFIRDGSPRPVFDTSVEFLGGDPEMPPDDDTGRHFPELVEPILPNYSRASVNTRELVHDRASDGRWWWTRDGARLSLVMRRDGDVPPFRITSRVPHMLSMRPGQLDAAVIGLGIVALLVLLFVAFSVARFIGRRLFVVDLVQPLAPGQGLIGLRHVICHPCDEAAAKRLFHDYTRIDLRDEAGLALAREAPQSLDFDTAVFIDGLGFECASGERSELVRALLERLTRQGDRTVVIRPTSLNVVTRALLRGEHAREWSTLLSSFVWVNWSQVVTSPVRGVTLSGAMPVFDGDETISQKPAPVWWRRLSSLSGFDSYVEQLTDARRAIARTLRQETEHDAYLQSVVAGLGTDATTREQVLDEISERAEEYYEALWGTCSPQEQVVLMQLAQTGLVNQKTRRDIRRLFARGLVLRDPQLRLFNETFRRYVLARGAGSAVADQLDTNLGGDAWSRFRVPFFAAVAVVMLFFFTTQRQTFDSTVALVSGLAASLPVFVKTLSGLGARRES